MLFSYKEWEKKFAPKLMGTRRWDGFSFIAKELSKVHHPKIFEVGCIRAEDAWDSDGQSTIVWDWIADKGNGMCTTVDVSEKHVALARQKCPNVGAYVSEGIYAITSNAYGHMSGLNLLFLDGMDFTGPHAYNAWMQHTAMLGAAWPNLKPGCLIAVDDCVDDGEGKHVLIKDFFRRMDLKPVVESYMHIWRMP